MSFILFIFYLYTLWTFLVGQEWRLRFGLHSLHTQLQVRKHIRDTVYKCISTTRKKYSAKQVQ